MSCMYYEQCGRNFPKSFHSFRVFSCSHFHSASFSHCLSRSSQPLDTIYKCMVCIAAYLRSLVRASRLLRFLLSYSSAREPPRLFCTFCVVILMQVYSPASVARSVSCFYIVKLSHISFLLYLKFFSHFLPLPTGSVHCLIFP